MTIGQERLQRRMARGAQFLAFRPPQLILGAFMGGMYLAIDTTAGERERQSLEPLLATPVPRGQIMLGKLSATSAFAIGSLLLTLVAFAVLLPALAAEAAISCQQFVHGHT